eukprot:scaffold34515_cov61-Phaeocystis_antarctica.AAC.3
MTTLHLRVPVRGSLAVVAEDERSHGVGQRADLGDRGFLTSGRYIRGTQAPMYIISRRRHRSAGRARSAAGGECEGWGGVEGEDGAAAAGVKVRAGV